MNNQSRTLADKHFAVTGAGTGIGKAIALRLAQEGARLSLLARREAPLIECATEAKALGAAGVFIASCDIADQSSVMETMDRSEKALGKILGFVANAGIGGPNHAGPQDRFDEIIQTNLMGTYYCLRAAETHLDERSPESCHLLVVSSILARFGVPGYTGYCASKTALLGLVRALAMELAPRNIQVNAICPGWVDTEMAREGIAAMAEDMGTSYEDALSTAMQAVPLGRMSQPEDVAEMAAWLLSTGSRGITGQGLDMNNGAFMS